MKKRFISMVLALSILLSLCPAAAFADTGVLPAEDPAGDIALLAVQEPTAPLEFQNGYPSLVKTNGQPRDGVRLSVDTIEQVYIYEGLGWVCKTSYTQAPDGSLDFGDHYTLILTADADLSGEVIAPNVDVVVSGGCTLKDATVNGDLTIEENGRVEDVTCNGKVTNKGTIGSGSFTDNVTNDGTIEDGNFTGDVTNNGTIKDGDFSGKVDNNPSGTIEDGTFTGDVTNNGTIKDGEFSDTGKVDNKKDGTIEDGKFSGDVKNDGTIEDGDFSGKVDNNQTGSIEDGIFSGDVNNNGKVDGGSFSGDVNGSGTISSGVFNGEDGKGPSGKVNPDAIRSTVRFYDGQFFNANDTLFGVTKLLVIGEQAVEVSTVSTQLNNVYHETADGTKNWSKLSRGYTETLMIEGGEYVLNLPELTAGNFTYDPDNRTITSTDGSISADDIKVSYYGPDDADHEAKPPFTEPGSYVVKISVPGTSERMEVSGLGSPDWAFTVDPMLTFDEAKITATRTDGTPVHDGDRLPTGTTVTLETTAADFAQWGISGVDGLDPDALTEPQLTFTVQKSNIVITLDALPPNGGGDSGTPLAIAAGVAGGAALYYLGATAFLRVILPPEVALPNNRAELANALWVMFGRPESSNTTEFVDVPANSPDLPAIHWALEQGIMTATVREDGTHFMPRRFTTRTESIWTWYKMYCKDAADARNASAS